ncbi:MAG: flagellar hook-associated protein FlgK [Chloroflexi bacterium]|nr:flagellar hook-associated protein FlgK [Chloroflexota bacterium]
MSSAFFGLDLALRALQAQQMGLDVTNHNVANANTEGYSRQNVQLVTTEPYTAPGMNRPATAGQLGTGVIAADVTRARNQFLDNQYRTELGGLKNAQARQDALEQVEVTLDEPQGVGLNNLFNEYYKVLNELASDPSDLPVRTAVVQQAISLTDAFNRTATQLAGIRGVLDGEIQNDITKINDITSQILQLNQNIVQVEVTGQTANDFRDRRDLLVDRLSELVNVTVSENADGSMNVLMGAQVLVNAATSKTDLFAVPNAGNGNYVDITYGSGGPAATLGTAEISGKLTARDTNVPSYQSQLDTIAANLISAVNTVHATGFDQNGNAGVAFFTGTNAATITVNAAIMADPKLIAASDTAGATGNNETILDLVALRSSMSPPLAVGTSTSESAYNALVAGLGTDSQSASNQTDTQQALVDLLSRRRQSLTGVSLDEEATNLLRYQRAYEAAARVMTAYDELLDKLINATGIVGR